MSQNHPTRGQVLVLACLSMLMIALMLMLSFNVTNAIHERIRIQAVADSQALSTATLEARAFNTMAFTNRSIAGTMVALMGLHAWWAIAESEVGMLNAGKTAFDQVAGVETGQCSFGNVHCGDARQARLIATQFEQQANNYNSNLRGLDQRFRQSVQALNDMMRDIHVDQKRVLDNTRAEIGSGSNTLTALKTISAPHASFVRAVDALNLSEMACALEGSNFDSRCQSQPWRPVGPLLAPSSRGAIMESAAMAARPRFEMGTGYWRSLAFTDFNGGGAGALGGNSQAVVTINQPRVPINVQREGTFTVRGNGLPKTWARDNRIGADLSPDGAGHVEVVWRHGRGTGVSSGPGANLRGRRESNSPYVGLPCTGDNCFINFRASTSAASDYGQPSTYGAVTQSLRLQLNGRPAPWELNQSGTVQLDFEQNRPARLVLVPRGQAFAVSKGKTYFHQLGPNGWQVPPNMFDPFWRAKLQSFQRSELQAVLQQIGDTDGANIIAGGGTVEGKIQ